MCGGMRGVKVCALSMGRRWPTEWPLLVAVSYARFDLCDKSHPKLCFPHVVTHPLTSPLTLDEHIQPTAQKSYIKATAIPKDLAQRIARHETDGYHVGWVGTATMIP